MTRILSARTLAVSIALGSALLLVAAAQASGSSHSRTGADVSLRKTALGTILVDARGRTLYLFEKDRNGASMCDSTCTTYWPPLTSKAAPRAGSGVRQALLRLTTSGHGARQVTYAGHPLYRFVGDTRGGQTKGEGLADFGAEWYALAANGRKVDREARAGDSSGSSSAGSSSGGW